MTLQYLSRLRIPVIAAMVMAVVMPACTLGDSNDDTRTEVTVSIDPQRYILEQIACPGTLKINTLIEPGADPETYEPSMSRRMATDRSAAYFTIGTLPFEQAGTSSIGDGVRVVDTSEGIKLMYGTHSHPAGAGAHQHHEAPDPHTWSSVANVRTMARTMTRTLCELIPDSAAVFVRRAKAFDLRLDSLDRLIRSRVPQGTAFAIWHPSLSYFARDYGLHQIAIGQETKDFSVRSLKAVIDSARSRTDASDGPLEVFFCQKEFDTRQAETVNRALDARLVTIYPLAYDWEAEMLRIADELGK